MGWRSVVISKPAQLSLGHQALHVMQDDGDNKQIAKVPLEDISVLIIDTPQVSLSTALLAACADAQIAVITVGENHLPNGVLLPYLSHSRTLKIMQSQLKLTVSKKKRIWRSIVQQKIRNQAAVLIQYQQYIAANRLLSLANLVRSGDSNNVEGQAAQIYFRTIFGSKFSRQQNCFHNAALNYGYAVIRAAIARTLCGYGFLPAFGLFHHNELNSFNLADDIIESYRPFVDAHVLKCYPIENGESKRNIFRDLTSQDKANLVSLLHHDIKLNNHIDDNAACTLLAGIEATVISLSSVVKNERNESNKLVLPQIIIPSAQMLLVNEIDDKPVIIDISHTHVEADF
jgi:CRISP-associated protein Cas1